MPLRISHSIAIDDDELVESFTRAGGPGGQHVNTTDSAVVLRFDVAASPNLPEAVKARLHALAGSRISQAGVITLRAEGSRSQRLNRDEVRERLAALVREALIVPKKRRPTRPSKSSQAKRLDQKSARSTVKRNRGKITD